MTARRQSAQKGMVLIEALLGILIFSIGILAMLGMQSVGMQTTVDAKYRSDAAYLANEVISQMWVDQGGVSQNNLPKYDTTNATAYAPRDNWIAEVQSTLPNATGANAPVITVSGSPPSQVAVTVKWQRPGGTPSQQTMIAEIKGASTN